MSNPHDEVCPDYLQPEFAKAWLVFTVGGKSEEEAAVFLETIWQFNNTRDIEKWDNKHEAEAKANYLAKENETLEEERQHILHEQEAETARQEERKKYKNKLVPIPNRPLSATASSESGRYSSTRERSVEIGTRPSARQTLSVSSH